MTITKIDSKTIEETIEEKERWTKEQIEQRISQLTQELENWNDKLDLLK